MIKRKNQSVVQKAPSPDLLQPDDLTAEIEKRIGNLVHGSVKTQVVNQVSALFREEYSGPIPHPRHLAMYEDACPGAADRILKMAEDSLHGQIDLAKASTASEISDRKIGMYLGFSSLVILIVSAVVCAISGQTVIAASFIGVGALGTVSKFIHGRNGNSDKKP